MKVVVIGEICVDEFIYCSINRLSPEAPVPVLNPIKTVKNAGMAGNTAANVKALAPESNIIYLIQEGDITKTRYVESKSNHMFLRVDKGEDNIKPFEWTSAKDLMITSADIVIVSDYNKGFLSNIDLKVIAAKSKLSILDSKRQLTDDITKDFTFVKLNEGEYKNNTHLNPENIIVTLGANGASFQDFHYPSPKPQETIDVSGAGDTFTASFIITYFSTRNVGASIMQANKKSSEVVSKRGVALPL
jgi:bifunctional ADP-heptose synthase (sugar kinase/adenylyltransferase)